MKKVRKPLLLILGVWGILLFLMQMITDNVKPEVSIKGIEGMSDLVISVQSHSDMAYCSFDKQEAMKNGDTIEVVCRNRFFSFITHSENYTITDLLSANSQFLSYEVLAMQFLQIVQGEEELVFIKGILMSESTEGQGYTIIPIFEVGDSMSYFYFEAVYFDKHQSMKQWKDSKEVIPAYAASTVGGSIVHYDDLVDLYKGKGFVCLSPDE